VSWIFEEQIVEEVDPIFVGFVYIITNKLNGKKYIGKKLLQFRRTKKIKGKSKKVLVESDWRQYFGSNVELNEDVKELGAENFDRTILRFCKSKGECSYWEAKCQFEFDVLLNPQEYYNSWIMVKVRRSHLSKILNTK
jgi:hypothetical protein